MDPFKSIALRALRENIAWDAGELESDEGRG